MKKQWKRILSLVLAVLLLVPGQVTAAPTPGTAWLVGVTVLPGGPDAKDYLTQVSGQIYLAQTMAQVEAYRAAGGVVRYVEPDATITLPDTDGGITLFDDEACGWAYTAVKASAAAERGLTGSGIRIGILDSGVNADVADLAGATIAEGFNCFDGGTDVMDDVGHGTRIAALIAGSWDDAVGVYGIAPGATIVPVKCFASDSNATLSMLIKSIAWAVDAKCRVLNMSWGIKKDAMGAASLHEALADAYAKGVVLVAASGNITSSLPAGTEIYPAGWDEVIGVTAVDSEMNRGTYAQENGCADVAAPGTRVYNGQSGTSYAAPIVVAMLAVALEYNPQATNAQLMAALKRYTQDIGEPGVDDVFGYGFARLDLLLDGLERDAITVELTPPETDAAPQATAQLAGAVSATCAVEWSQVDTAKGFTGLTFAPETAYQAKIALPAAAVQALSETGHVLLPAGAECVTAERAYLTVTYPPTGARQTDAKSFTVAETSTPYSGAACPAPVTSAIHEGHFRLYYTGVNGTAYECSAVPPTGVGAYALEAVVLAHDGYPAATVALGSWEITKKPVTISGVTAADKIYDGTTVATPILTGATVDGVVPGDELSLQAGRAAFASADAGGQVQVTFSDFCLTGADEASYVLASQPPAVDAAIAKAATTGTPYYQTILSGGHTLADAALSGGTLSPGGGTLRWDLGDAQAVEPGVAYRWSYTPRDAANYEPATGLAVLYERAHPATQIGARLEAAGVVEGDTVSFSFTEQEVAQALPAAHDALTLAITTDGAVDTVAFYLPAAALAQVGSAGKALVLHSSFGSLTLDCAAVRDLSAGADGEVALTLHTERAASLTLPQGWMQAGTVETALRVTVRAGGRALTAIGGSMTLCVPANLSAGVAYRAAFAGEQLYAMAYEENGARYARLTLPAPGTVAISHQPVFTFSDVAVGSWYYENVAYGVTDGLFQGVSDTQFAPDRAITRAMLVVLMHRMEGLPQAGGTMTFTDVQSSGWYKNAVAWASEQGIVTGFDALTFGPDRAITREQMATILYRYAAYKGNDVTAFGGTSLEAFTDCASISTWADAAMRWACGAGLLNGANGALSPQGTARRAQAAAVLQRFLTAQG